MVAARGVVRVMDFDVMGPQPQPVHAVLPPPENGIKVRIGTTPQLLRQLAVRKTVFVLVLPISQANTMCGC
jgi:hypothetical protein